VNNDWLDIELLEDYLDGKLDSKAMHKIEKQALEDPFVAQALAGLSQSPKRSKDSVSLLQKQLYDRIAQQHVVKKDSVFTWQRLSVAAAAAVMFISVSTLFIMRERENREKIARNTPRKVDVNIAPSPLTIDTVAVDSAKSEMYAANSSKISSRSIAEQQINSDKKVFRAQQSTMSTDTSIVKAAETDKVTSSARVASVAAPAISSPVGGWAKLDTYLNENNKLRSTANAGKFVELSFVIDSEGNPADLKILNGAEKELNDEAVRLIKEGPKWEQPSSPDSRIQYTIAF